MLNAWQLAQGKLFCSRSEKRKNSLPTEISGSKIRGLVCFTHRIEIHEIPAAVRQHQLPRETLHVSTQGHGRCQEEFAMGLLLSPIRQWARVLQGFHPKCCTYF